ncbi:polycomb group protein Psc-like [Hydractinia symbiolongicarpus]|uniref:polycomb group protein Psc-like n=1 Tax=Hydractinia symbiolongicarpus TaxID=13093 RepID=UPI00254E34BA|nr:polycomb group protein Psc-like [Hydractinia symbiolongicarpus]
MEPLMKKIKIRSLNPHLVCLLCAGYFVDTTTIVECLHTFCKSCIVRYLQTRKHCPACGILIHETEPLSKLKLDRTMQDVVAKLLPHVVEDERKREAEFYAKINNVKLKDKRKVVAAKPDYDFSNFSNSHRYDNQINICLELDKKYTNIGEIELSPLHDKYVLCSSRAQIIHLKKIIQRFYEQLQTTHQLFLTCDGVFLNSDENLRQVFIIHWKRKPQPMILHYSFRRNSLNAEDIVRSLLQSMVQDIVKSENDTALNWQKEKQEHISNSQIKSTVRYMPEQQLDDNVSTQKEQTQTIDVSEINIWQKPSLVESDIRQEPIPDVNDGRQKPVPDRNDIRPQKKQAPHKNDVNIQQESAPDGIYINTQKKTAPDENDINTQQKPAPNANDNKTEKKQRIDNTHKEPSLDIAKSKQQDEDIKIESRAVISEINLTAESFGMRVILPTLSASNKKLLKQSRNSQSVDTCSLNSCNTKVASIECEKQKVPPSSRLNSVNSDTPGRLMQEGHSSIDITNEMKAIQGDHTSSNSTLNNQSSNIIGNKNQEIKESTKIVNVLRKIQVNPP